MISPRTIIIFCVAMGAVDAAYSWNLFDRFFSTYNISVFGETFCGYDLLENVQVQLLYKAMGRENVLNEVKSTIGLFSLFGDVKSIMGIEPILRFTHSCINGIFNEGCNGTSEYQLPMRHIGKEFGLGIINMNLLEMMGDSIVCRKNLEVDAVH